MSVRVKLITRDDSLKVDEAPISVPVTLKRYGLSEVVNQLLQTTEPIPFDFLVDGKLLRTTLDSYLTQNGMSAESIVTLEYVRAILPPTFMASFEHDDWVASVHAHENEVATGSYDGVVRIWDRSGTVQHQFEGHRGAVLATKWLSRTKLVSGSRDRNLHIWNTEGKELSGILKGHTAPVTSVAVLKNHRFVSGSQDSTLRVWTSHVKELPAIADVQSSNQQASMKRRRIAENASKAGRTKTSLAALRGHTAAVTGVVAHPIESADVVYSVSEDHTLRTWDLVTSQCVDTKTTGFSLLSVLALGEPTGLIACGSSARHIALVDPRSGTHASVKQLAGHKNFVVSLSANPLNAYQFASASHDGTIKLWDCRADRAMYTIERPDTPAEERDLYCVDWQDCIYAGGRNKKLEMISAPH